MATNAVIGALRVDLGLNSAQFNAGLKAAQTNLASFGKAMAKGLGLVSVAAAGAAAALGVAVKGAIDHADELSKASQKIGVSVEALSRLEYAAQLSDVSLEQLTSGLGKFSKAIVEAASNSKSGPANVFSALGISIKDAAGNLRANDEIFAEVADRFSRIEDGALKTSVAMQLFGKSGAELIPLLNSGRDGLAYMSAEADRLGLTISTKTARGAEEFNDTLTRIGAILQGVVNQIMQGALPALQQLADFMVSPVFQQAARQLGASMVAAFQSVIEWIGQVETRWQQFLQFVETQGRPKVRPLGSTNIEDRTTPGWLDTYRAAGGVVGSSFNALGGATTYGSTDAMWKALQPVTNLAPLLNEGAEAARVFADTLAEGIKTTADYAQEIGDGLAGAFTSFADAVMSGVPAIEALSDVLGDLGKQLLNSAISGFFTNLFGGMFGTIAGGSPIPKTGFIPGITGPKLFAGGGITDRPAIFGDAGPEAAVPLPDGRTIPVTLSGGSGGGRNEVLIRLDQGLVAQILKQADANAVQVVKTQAAAAVAATQRNRGL